MTRSAATRKERRAARKRIGEREITRRATAHVERILELSDKGLSIATIASSTGLKPATVRAVLDLREEEAS